MAGTAINTMIQPAVSASGAVDTLLIEKFNGEVHKAYTAQEGLINKFQKQSVVGTNMISNKYMSRSQLQRLTPGQEAEATDIVFDKNALIVDTIVLARNYINDLHRLQNDFEVMSALAADQAALMREHEDKMIIQQVLAAGLTGGAYDYISGDITGGQSRLKDHGVAIKTDISTAQADDPYRIVSALEITAEGLMRQKVPLAGMICKVPLPVFSMLVDYGYIALTEGGANQMLTSGMAGTLKPYGISVEASTEYTIERSLGAHGSLLSNDDNGNRYNWTADMSNTLGVIYGDKALMVGETIGMQSDIFYDKKNKGNYVDTWMSNGATSDRYDNVGVVTQLASSSNAGVERKAKAKAKATRTI